MTIKKKNFTPFVVLVLLIAGLSVAVFKSNKPLSKPNETSYGSTEIKLEVGMDLSLEEMIELQKSDQIKKILGIQNIKSINLEDIEAKSLKEGVVHVSSFYAPVKNTIPKITNSYDDPCFKENSWFDIESGDSRTETVQIRGEGECRHVINIRNGFTGSVLAIYPDKSEQGAKWIMCSDEYGIGYGGIDSDPYQHFLGELTVDPENEFIGKRLLIGTTKWEGKDVYIVSDGPSKIRVGYEITFYDASSFFPVREVYMTDGLARDKRYSVGEILQRSEVENLFKQEVPPGFYLYNIGCKP